MTEGAPRWYRAVTEADYRILVRAKAKLLKKKGRVPEFVEGTLRARILELESQVANLLEMQGDQDQKLKDAEAREERLRGALVMAKQHMIVNDLSLPNVFAVIDATLQETKT